jgi:hypothetical protein
MILKKAGNFRRACDGFNAGRDVANRPANPPSENLLDNFH